MEMLNKVTQEKLNKTIDRVQKAIQYNDFEYVFELVNDLAEFAFFAGYNESKNGNLSVKEVNVGKSNMMTETIEAQTAMLISNLGIPSHIKGYRFLIDAIAYVYKDARLISKTTKILYPLIAEKNNTTASRVERAIRHSIKVGWSRGNAEKQSEIFEAEVTTMNFEPTNSEFIHRLSTYLRIQNGESLLVDKLVNESPEKGRDGDGDVLPY